MTVCAQILSKIPESTVNAPSTLRAGSDDLFQIMHDAARSLPHPNLFPRAYVPDSERAARPSLEDRVYRTADLQGRTGESSVSRGDFQAEVPMTRSRGMQTTLQGATRRHQG